MAVRDSTRDVSLKVLPEVKGAIQRAVSRVLQHDMKGLKEPSERYQNSHHVEAVMCWFLNQPVEVQDRIVLEGRSIVRRLKAMETPKHDFGPDTFPSGAAPLAVPTKGGNDHGRDTVGHATTVPEVIRRNTGRAARGASGKKKRPKSQGRPVLAIDE